MTTAEAASVYSVQLQMNTQVGTKVSRTISGVINEKAAAVLATEDSNDNEALTNFESYCRALINLTTTTYGDAVLIGKSSVNDISAAIIGG